MNEPASLLCPCGAPAPAELPAPGAAPARCSRCATPLVAPGPVSASSFERGLGAALVVAVLGAVGWMALCKLERGGAPWTLAVAGLVVGLVARAAARARGGRVQLAAGIALLVFFVLGEFLLYRHALLPRLEAMHAEEGAVDADVLAEREKETIYADVDFGAALDRLKQGRPLQAVESVWPGRYASIEATRDLFLAMAAGVAAALWLTRARPAVAAFRAPVIIAPVVAPAPDAVPAETVEAATPPAESPTTTSSPPSGPASPGSEPPSPPPPDAS